MRDLARAVALAERGRAILARAGSNPLHDAGGRTARRDWYHIQAATRATGRTTVRLYGYIGDTFDGTGAAEFVTALDDIGTGGIDLHINSGGGSVFDGIAIHAALRNHPSDVKSYVDGVAASAASFVAMAGDEVVVEKPAKLMIHDAQGLTLGSPAAHREMADLLDELSDTIAEMYADRAGGTTKQWRAAMQAETWYSAAEAVKAGLADRVANDSKQTTAPEGRRTQMIRARARVALRGA